MRKQDDYLWDSYSEEDIQAAIYFDLACFHSILTYLFHNKLSGASSIEERDYIIDKEMTKNEGEVYEKFMKEKFKKEYIEKEAKINNMLNLLEKVKFDILFMQKADQEIRKAIQRKFPHYWISQ